MRTRTLLPISLIAVLAALSAVRLSGQQADAVAAAAPAAAPAVTAATQPAAPAPSAAVATKGKDAAGRDTLSVDFPDEDIRNILRNVADLFELNIIMPETLQGKTTIKLRDVTWRQIFENVLKPVGYTYVEDGNIIKIVSNESLAQEPVSTEVFLVNYAKAGDILPTVSSLVDAAAGGKIVVDGRSNSLVITERPSRMNRIRPIIEQLDRATDQVMIETKFVEVNNTDSKDIGVNWASLRNYNIGVGNLTETVSRNRGQTFSDGANVNNLTGRNAINGTTADNTTATTAGQTSGATNTGAVTATSGSPSSTSTTGTNSSLTNGTTVTANNGTNNSVSDTINNTLNLLNAVTNTGDTARQVTALFTASQFNLVLSALQTLSDVKIVSNPTIVTLNNTEASINIGESDPLPNYTFNQQTGTQEVSGFTYKDIGIILKVTPQVNARGSIKLTLSPEVSQKNGTLTFGAAQLPVIATRKATTTISLKDGYTMGIGGLLNTQTTKSGTRVPLLGSVPVLGRLFRSDTKNTSVTNLIIFITAKTLSADGAPIEQVFESERVRGLELRREDLPGHRDGSSPFVPDAPPMPTGPQRTRS